MSQRKRILRLVVVCSAYLLVLSACSDDSGVSLDQQLDSETTTRGDAGADIPTTGSDVAQDSRSPTTPGSNLEELFQNAEELFNTTDANRSGVVLRRLGPSGGVAELSYDDGVETWRMTSVVGTSLEVTTLSGGSFNLQASHRVPR